jgi:hypothetical protein
MQIVPAVLEAPRDMAHKEHLMDEVSVTCPAENPAPGSTESRADSGDAAWGTDPLDALIASSHLCDQVAFLLGVSEKSARRAFLGEPVRVVLGMAGWILSREDEDGFDAEFLLPRWAKRRGRGMWREEDRRVERCAYCVAGSTINGKRAEARGGRAVPMGECTCCRGSGIRLKPLDLGATR